ncbi:MAG: sodium:solute symporter family protein [Spirochaetaceae bacterium]|jgi:SSS family solute:Na+ symporter|nr:sodium:solute symporter family protein [Spirochaetaceae bacterium]
MQMTLTFIGVAVFIIICWRLAFFYNRRTKNIDDFLVSGRAVGFWVLIGSYIGGAIGGSSIAGFTGYGWSTGMLNFFAIFPASVILFLFILFFSKRLSILGAKYHLVSIPDFLAVRFGDAIRVPSVLFVFFRMGFIVGLQIMSLGLIFVTGFGVTLPIGMLIGGILLIGYVAIGGMMASIIVEWFQSLLQSIVIVAVALTAMFIVGKGNIFAAFDAAKSVMAGKPNFSFSPFDLPVNQIVNYAICMGLYYLGDQWCFQRVFVAAKPDVAFKSLTLGSVLGAGFGFLPFLAGIMLRAGAEMGVIPIPLDTRGDNVFFYYVINVLPAGATVFFLVAFMAAVMSCGSAFLMGGSPLVVRDVYQSFINKNATQKQLVRVGRIGILIVAAFGVIGAFAIPNLVILFNMGNVFTACGVLVPVLACFFWKRATSRGGIMACWIGGFTGLFGCIWSLNNGGSYMLLPNGFPIVLMGLIASLAALIVFSLTQKAQPDEISHRTLYSKLLTTDKG